MGYSIIFQNKFEHFYTQPLEKSQFIILYIEVGVLINQQKNFEICLVVAEIFQSHD